jgi:hypothetical protein
VYEEKKFTGRLMEKIKHFPFYVLFISLFPALSLLAINLGQTAMWVVRRPLLISIGIGILFYLLSWFIVRNVQKASLLASWAIILFFTYGHIYRLIEDIEVASFVIGRHRYLILLFGLIFLGGSWAIIKRIRISKDIVLGLNVVSLLLVAYQFGQIIAYQIEKDDSQSQARSSLGDTFLSPADPGNLPDIYLIILDMYGREDAIALDDNYDYDNSEFIADLRDLGFYVADCARSNYSHTSLSLSSQLNMNYLDELLDIDTVNLESASYLLRNSEVRRALEEIGYTSIAFDMGAEWANIDAADRFYTTHPEDRVILNLYPFELLFLEGSIMFFPLDYYMSRNPILFEFVETPIERKAQRTEMVLEHLRVLPSIEGPKFVHAHIMVPHPPHVFNPDGSVNLQAEQIEGRVGYSIQMNYLNPQILEIVEKIKRNASPEPIIILEGDHASGSYTRTSILAALYLPQGGEETLYPQMSLVNSFRIIFNEYFGTELPLLDDRSYMHTEEDWYELVPLEEWNPECLP